MQAISRTFAILRSLAEHGGSAQVGEVASSTGLPKSTVSRLLVALADEGMVDRLDDSGRYGIGPGLAALAGNVSMVGTIREVCRPYLRDLVEQTGEAAGLSVPDGPLASMYIDHVASPGDVVIRDWTGLRFPYHTVAGGYALMSTWSDDRVADYAAVGLEAFTDVTETTLAGVKRRIGSARRHGWVWTLGDFSTDINGVGSPVVDADGGAVAAISVYGPSYRFPDDRDRLGRLVLSAAHAVTRRLRGE